jgi:hypothetical protein
VLAYGEPGGLKGVIDGFLAEILQFFADEVPELASDRVRGWLAPVVPGLIGISWVLMMAINGILAQVLVGKSGIGIRPTPSFAELEVPGWMVTVLAVGVLLAMLPEPAGFIGVNLAILFAGASAFVGFAVIHTVVRTRSGSRAILFGVYAVVFLLSWPILMVIGLGVIEQTMGLRRRWSAGAHQGDE